MIKVGMKVFVRNTLLATALLAAVPVQAATILTLSGPVLDLDQVQQTSQTPSIFAGATPTQPSGFGWEQFPNGGGNGVTYNATTGTGAVDWNNGGGSGADYTVAQIITALGGVSAFNVGIDTNTTNAASEILELFEVKVDSGTGWVSQFEYNGFGAIAPANNNGTGWSDYLLSTVDLSGFSATDLVQFHVIINGAVDGQEQLFLIAAPVPVPAAIWLFGSGLLGLIAAGRRRK